MKTIYLSVVLMICFATGLSAQSLFVSGPMCGHTELRTAHIWTAVQPSVSGLQISWWAQQQGRADARTKVYSGKLGREFNPATFTLTGLEPGTRYQYEISAGTKGHSQSLQKGSFSTQSLWQWRQPAPDFSFLAGSCAYFNEPAYDRPGTPYGGDSSIFLTMAGQTADFMLWLGDNWYTREADYGSPWGLRYRAHHDRSQPILQPFLGSMPHYAIWDDHDFGPNDFGSSYLYKEESREVFMDYWANPSFGQDGHGTYTQFNYNDVAFFLLDDRTWRSPDALRDTLNGIPNPEKRMFGPTQLRWLKDALLLQRYAPFKIIATGSQVLNPQSPYDCFQHFGTEFRELMDFIEANKISGVVFLTGDRHHSEIIRIDRPGNYPLFDITASPLTAHVYPPAEVEQEMKARVPGTLVTEQNFARISVSGDKGARLLKVQFLGLTGLEQAQWEVSENDLKMK